MEAKLETKMPTAHSPQHVQTGLGQPQASSLVSGNTVPAVQPATTMNPVPKAFIPTPRLDVGDVESQTHTGATQSLNGTPPTTASSPLSAQHQLKHHKKRWCFALTLTVMLSVGSGILVGILAHRADLGLLTTTAVAAVVSCVEMYLFSVVG